MPRFDINRPEPIPAELEQTALKLKELIEQDGASSFTLALEALLRSEHSVTLFKDLHVRPSFFFDDALEAAHTLVSCNAPYDSEEDSTDFD